MNSEKTLQDFERNLQNNEIIIAAILENIQLGRLDESFSLHRILQSNLSSIGKELDNYPSGTSDPYSDLWKFPDALTADIVSKAFPHIPLVPPCWSCACNNVSISMSSPY